MKFTSALRRDHKSCTHPARPGSNSERGFTLIELMVVLVIIALFSSLIAPSVVSTMHGSGLKSIGYQLCEMLNFAGMSAMTRHRSVVVNLDTKRGRCWVTVSVASLPWIEQGDARQNQVLAAMTLPEQTQLSITHGQETLYDLSPSTSWETLTFRNDGSTEDTLIRLTGSEGGLFEIEVFGVTGEVHGREVVP